MLDRVTTSPAEAAASITAHLGIHGWSDLDPILLAALAQESPLLLVGPHGTGKSLLVERIAHALELEMRHYNASLLNYDDLVGIPMPDETGTQLDFIRTPGTIWDAGFVFFDEISRCRADLQNKLFPIVHERRIVGIELQHLEHRWAAMNPPAPENPDLSSAANTYYFGSDPLDPALIDRFPFIVQVPAWDELSHEDRIAMLDTAAQSMHIEHNDPSVPGLLNHLIAETRHHMVVIAHTFADWLSDYVINLMDFLAEAELAQSPRRAAMLSRSIVTVHAARIALYGDMADIETSVEMAIKHSIPQTATDVPPSPVTLLALHRQAWELSQVLEDDIWRQIMRESDPAVRIAMADQLDISDGDMSRLITQAIGGEASDPRQVGLAVAIFMAFKDRRNLDASAYEPLAQLATSVMTPRTLSRPNYADATPEGKTWQEIKKWIESEYDREDSLLFRLERNFLLNGFLAFWPKTTSWQTALEQFRDDLKCFNIQEVS